MSLRVAIGGIHGSHRDTYIQSLMRLLPRTQRRTSELACAYLFDPETEIELVSACWISLYTQRQITEILTGAEVVIFIYHSDPIWYNENMYYLQSYHKVAKEKGCSLHAVPWLWVIDNHVDGFMPPFISAFEYHSLDPSLRKPFLCSFQNDYGTMQLWQRLLRLKQELGR